MKTKRLFSVLILAALLPLAAVADTYQDPTTLVNYEYYVGQSEASVKKSSSATGDIAILSSFTVDGNEYSVTRIEYNAFRGCSGLTSVTIPEGVTSIGYSAFYGCSSLETTIISEGVTTIGYSAFYGCSSLESITIPEGVTTIDYNTFRDCCSLTSVNIPSSVTSIGSFAFYGCSSLTSVSIPSSVTSIDSFAFFGCTGLTSVTSLIQEPFEISEGVFQYYYDGGYKFTSATLHVPKGTKEKYEVTAAWNEFQDIVEIGDVPTGIDAISHGEGDGAATVTERYALGGHRIGAGQRGLNIVRMSDGTVRKVVVK